MTTELQRLFGEDVQSVHQAWLRWEEMEGRALAAEARAVDVERVAPMVNFIERMDRSAATAQRRGRYDDVESFRNKAIAKAVELSVLLRRALKIPRSTE